ncbi:hypothetical protein FACS1894101_2200 [Betaproteobacteria bacterium]|nr:hypothetical protein FACS1894101_2200 [Betaproteobacteria bacterium]
MSAVTIFNLDEKWALCAGGQLRELPDYPALDSPALVLTDFGKSASDVFVASKNSPYLDAIIARRVRDEGQIDGETKVLIHTVERVGGSYQVLYTAVPMETWQGLEAWSESQPEHCLLISHVALMSHLLSAQHKGKEDTAVVFHCNREIALLVRRRGVLSYYAILALSVREEDFLETARTLIARIPAAGGIGNAKLKLNWYTLGAAVSDELEDALVTRLPELCPVQVRYFALPATTQDAQGSRFNEALQVFSQPLRAAKLAANSSIAKINYVAESLLPTLCKVMLVLALALFIRGSFLFFQAYRINSEVELLQQETQRLLADGAPASADSHEFHLTRDLVERMSKAQAGIDPYVLLRDLQRAAGSNVHLLAVRLEPGVTTIEGWIEQKGGRDDALAAFLVELRKLGFTPEAVALTGRDLQHNGAFAYRLNPSEVKAGASI